MTRAATTRLRVGGDAGYDVLVGTGVLAGLPDVLEDGIRRVLVVHARALRDVARTVQDQLAGEGRQVVVVQVPDGEEAKTAAVLVSCWEVLGQNGFTRSDVVIGVGGGAVTDLAGFVAATWLRGVPVIQVPTTLLGMVDAAVGGKTGINTAEGKNLVGAFHPPVAVICDLGALATLPVPDLVAGMGEIVKCGFVADPVILDLISADPVAAVTADSPVLRELVERSIAVKARVVTEDLKEAGLREILNYGHTFAHAIEQVETYTWRHGEAVSVGLVYAAELAALAGRLPPDVVTRHREMLTLLGLPTSYRPDRWPLLLAAMRRDKKTRGDLLRFVILEDVARPARLEGPSPELLEAAYLRVSSPL